MTKRTFAPLLVLAFVATACGTASTPTATTGESAPPAETAVPTATLDTNFEMTIWMTGDDVERPALLRELLADFAEDYPGLTFDVSNFPLEDIRTALQLAFESGEPPDLVFVSPGPTNMLAYAQAGYLQDLTTLAADRGWLDRVSESVLRFYNPDDHLWGIPYDLAAVGMFYSPTVFDELSLSVPQTWDELEAVVDKIQEAGIVPSAVGALDRYPAAHALDSFIHAHVPFDNIKGVATLDPSAAWDTPEMLAAAEAYESWFRDGHFHKDSAALSNSDAVNLFTNGDVALFLAGSWNTLTIVENAGFEAGFFALPPTDAVDEWHMGGYTPNSHWVIPTDSPHPEMAVEVLDFLIGPTIAEALWDRGTVVTYSFDAAPEPVNSIQGDIYAATQATQTGYYIDQGAPEIRETYWTSIQEMIGGAISGPDIMTRVQETYLSVLE